ncbi:hypothetical protein ACR79H_20640 [Sphingobacterium spiritivorum]|uniref:hypothetical protein n=1 Tax=Sphingobacterium spiritivorum TaxID=258 RepID=UPI003DA481D9
MEFSYARGKIGVAVEDLATGIGNIKERILDAYVGGFHTLGRDDFPEELKEYWDKINEVLTKEEPTYNEKGEAIKGSAENSLLKISNDDAVELARSICYLDAKLQDSDWSI